MRFHILSLALLGGLLAACSNQGPATHASVGKVPAAHATQHVASTSFGRPVSTAADAPDTGALFQYTVGSEIHRGAMTLRPVAISEEHALKAITEGGELVIPQADGQTQRVKYDRRVVHNDGNWTWVGKDATTGEQTVLTFGDKAVFGSLPSRNGKEYQLTSANGRTWLIETDTSKLPAESRNPDFIEATDTIAALLPAKPASSANTGVVAPKSSKHLSAASASMTKVTAGSVGVQELLVHGMATVDIALGYTTGFATRLGGTSQAVTRLRYLVDLANTAFSNSQFQGQFRLVRTVQVNYPDDTSNRSALFALTGLSCTNATTGGQLPDGGVTCTAAPVPAALQPLRDARETYGADLVGLVRNFSSPGNQSCGIGWLNGGGQTTYDANDQAFGFSVISDTNGNVFPDPAGSANTCREDGLAHEFGHNLGLQHNREVAQETDDSNGDGNLLDPEEFGAFAYSFGYSTDANNGNFYTIMSVRGANQTYYRTFSNPNSTFCGGAACGDAGFSDNVRSLTTTFPIAAAFRATKVDFDDVPEGYWAFDSIRTIANAGITVGCRDNSPEVPSFCPEDNVTRAQMAVFLIRTLHGITFVPPAATGTFADVPTNDFYAPWIEQLARDGVTNGCAPGLYCPNALVLREEMAVFLLRAKLGAGFTPAPATGVFADVPPANFYAPWIERLSADGITTGCQASPKLYCPGAPVSRAQMAVFLPRAFTF